MSQTTNDFNSVTSVILGVSCRLLIYVLVFFLMYLGITRGYKYGHEIFAPTAVAQEPGTDRELAIEEGDSVKDVAKKLKQKGLIKDSLVFEIQAKLYEYEVYPGTYTLNTSETSKEMLRRIDEDGRKNEAGTS